MTRLLYEQMRKFDVKESGDVRCAATMVNFPANQLRVAGVIVDPTGAAGPAGPTGSPGPSGPAGAAGSAADPSLAAIYALALG